MREIYQWIENIAFYSVLLVLVTHVLPAGEQKRYVQFFMGLVFMLLIFSPILRVMGQEERVAELFQRAAYDQEVEEFLREQKRLGKNLEDFTIEMLIEAAGAESEGAEGGESGDDMAKPDGEGAEPGNRGSGEGTTGQRDREPEEQTTGQRDREPEEQTTGQGAGEPGERTAGQGAGRLVEPVEIRIGEDQGNPS